MALSVGDLDLRAVSDALGQRALTSVEATEAYLRRIDAHDGVLRSYITVTADAALAQAKAADAEIASGRRRGPMHGVPIALKDLIAVAGVKMTSGSQVLADHVPAQDAFVTRRLKDAGAVLLGKLAMHEWAFGRPATDGPFPTGRNPWDVTRAPAGSSSGSAVAAAAGLCAGALGSDTGGSIRGPAAMTGLVGHKPTYGLVSRSGVLALSWSLDHVGPMTRGVWDSAVLLQAIAGADPDDTSTRGAQTQDYVAALEGGARGLRLGLLKRYYVDFPGLNDEVRAAALTAFDVLRKEGAIIEDVDAPLLDLALPMWQPIMAEAYEYHAETLRKSPEKYRDGLRTRIYMGALVTAQDFLHAQRLRERFRREVDALLSKVDALIFPGQMTPAVKFEDFPTSGFAPASIRYTAPWNLLGLPAAVVPSGFTRDGLPVSIQIVGRRFDDATVLRIARAYERVTEWHRRRPDPARWRL
ncbi:MAG TPA: amidase [Methylomirabilota bacterium]|jgi:aspartyl-tRNA(Asn)/glutamyl-tRNA(Gln) amidotransferase subunit A|nr:amidase [Methylomirabilota bacterium]